MPLRIEQWPSAHSIHTTDWSRVKILFSFETDCHNGKAFAVFVQKIIDACAIFQARHYAPSTIFVDEVDGICSSRDSSSDSAVTNRVKNLLLLELQGKN